MWNYLSLLLLLSLLQVSSERKDTSGCPKACVCDNRKRSVLCQNRNLTKVPAAIPEMTRKLDLQGNVFKVIPPRVFQTLSYLTHLDLQNCQLKQIEKGTFTGLPYLAHLNLASNNISVLHKGALDGLLLLRRLVLEHNQLKEIQPGTFSQLPYLNLLSLAHNSLRHLPDMTFRGLVSAWWLRLSHNALSDLAPESLAALPHLRRLSLDHNKLQDLPWEALSHLYGLAHLDLGHNPLTHLGKEEGLALPELRYLALDGASLQTIDVGAFSHCPQLYTVDLRDNQLKTLPSLQGLDRLHKLNLSGNPLRCDCAARPLWDWASRNWVTMDGLCEEPRLLRGEALESLREEDLRCQGPRDGEEEQEPTGAPGEDKAAKPCPSACTCSALSHHSSCENKGLMLIPSGFPNTTQLLDLNWNKFTSVPQFSFPNLSSLVSLHLQHCKITRLAPGALTGLDQLIYLYLSDNQISELSAAALQGVPRLRYLYLDRNYFTRVPRDILWALPRLVHLHLEQNALQHLALRDLAAGENLHWLHLSGNNISDIFPGSAQNLEGLYLGSNRLQAVPTAALEGLPVLRELELSGNPLGILQEGAFMPVAKSLQHLYLNNTGLQQISPGAFAGLEPGLRSLYLEKNQLQTLPAMDDFIQLEVINLSENPLHCDCKLFQLHRWLASQKLPGEATCEFPPSAQGQKVKEATAIFEACLGKKVPLTSQHEAKNTLGQRSQWMPAVAGGYNGRSRSSHRP
ncbi:chondroadherin-like protein [Dromiciops gliroides]|uniref:chondroadherin-like protein n=1 Tax=Dromiciops gliroides TaxID=33562 RepID=UPI001CC5ED00|nr:chondroadherin-like protein [Dromiciops gliroides]